MRYWLGSEYLGIGSAAHSFFGGARFSNEPDVKKYIEAVKKARSPVCERETLTREDRLFEYIMLRLRTTRGIRPGEFYGEFGFDFRERFKSSISAYTALGHMLSDEAHTALTPKGFLISNSIIADILSQI